MQRVHAGMISQNLGEQLIGHISRNSTAIEARQRIAKQDKSEEEVAQAKALAAKPRHKPGQPKKGEVGPAPDPGPLERQRGQTLAILRLMWLNFLFVVVGRCQPGLPATVYCNHAASPISTPKDQKSMN